MSALSFVDWLALFGHFLVLSMLAIGGAIVVAPDVHRVLVGQTGLLTDAQFTSSIAIAQAAPGPNLLYVAVAGYQAAGLAGVAATMGGMMLPSTTVALLAARWGRTNASARGVRAFKAGLAPVTIALLFATCWVLVAQSTRWTQIALALIAGICVWRTRLHLLWLIGLGAIVGALGWA